MKIAISNIGWNSEDFKEVLSKLKEYGVTGLELALTKTSDEEINEVKTLGFEFVSLQSLFYGVQGVTFFSEDEKLEILYSRLEEQLKVGKELGVKNVVFGSPTMRKTTGLFDEFNLVKFFNKINSIGEKYGISINIEANPKEYGGDILCTNIEVIDFVNKLGLSNIGYHLDTGSVIMNQENISDLFQKLIPKSIQVSNSNLQPIYEGRGMNGMLQELKDNIEKFNYNGYCSIEIKNTGDLRDIYTSVLYITTRLG